MTGQLVVNWIMWWRCTDGPVVWRAGQTPEDVDCWPNRKKMNTLILQMKDEKGKIGLPFIIWFLCFYNSPSLKNKIKQKTQHTSPWLCGCYGFITKKRGVVRKTGHTVCFRHKPMGVIQKEKNMFSTCCIHLVTHIQTPVCKDMHIYVNILF